MREGQFSAVFYQNGNFTRPTARVFAMLGIVQSHSVHLHIQDAPLLSDDDDTTQSPPRRRPCPRVPHALENPNPLDVPRPGVGVACLNAVP